MKHVDEIDLIEYAAGNLTEPRAARVREHAAACPECLRRLQRMEGLWQTLGDCKVEAAEYDVTDRVLSLAREEQPGVKPEEAKFLVRTKLPLQILRVAASIIIAIGLGHKLGEYSVKGGRSQVAPSQQRPEYLSALAMEWSSGLARLALVDDAPDTGAEQ